MSAHKDPAFRRPLPAETKRRCGHTPPGMLSTEPLHRLVCVLAPGHEGQHVNAQGDKWGYVARGLERVPERVMHLW